MSLSYHVDLVFIKNANSIVIKSYFSLIRDFYLNGVLWANVNKLKFFKLPGPFYYAYAAGMKRRKRRTQQEMDERRWEEPEFAEFGLMQTNTQ